MKPKNPNAVNLGRLGGLKATQAQKDAAAINGKKGGRPRTSSGESQNASRINGRKGGRKPKREN